MKSMLTTRCIGQMLHTDRKTLRAWIRQYEPGDLCISAITMAELEMAVRASTDPVRNRLALMLFLSQIDVLAFDAEAAEAYAKMKQEAQQDTENVHYTADSLNQLDAAEELLRNERYRMITSHAQAEGVPLMETME